MNKPKNAKKQWKRLAGKRRWSETEAREVVEGWRASGQGVETFAREQGVGAWRLRYWAPRLEVGASRSAEASKSKARLRLVPAVITGAGHESRPAVVIRLLDGIAVELHDAEHTDAQNIGELVARLRGATS